MCMAGDIGILFFYLYRILGPELHVWRNILSRFLIIKRMTTLYMIFVLSLVSGLYIYNCFFDSLINTELIIHKYILAQEYLWLYNYFFNQCHYFLSILKQFVSECLKNYIVVRINSLSLSHFSINLSKLPGQLCVNKRWTNSINITVLST